MKWAANIHEKWISSVGIMHEHGKYSVCDCTKLEYFIASNLNLNQMSEWAYKCYNYVWRKWSQI